MSLLTTYKFLTTHPLTRKNKFQGFSRFIKWQLKSRLNGKPITHQFTDKTLLIVEPGMTGATGNVYAGLHDFMEMGFLLHFLRPGDLFVDVGANVGSYSVLAGGHVGAEVIAIEPVKQTFDKLLRNFRANKMNGAVTINKAVGDYEGNTLFNISKVDTISRVATQGDEGNTEVPIDTLDNILRGHEPTLIKIDVEGYEEMVLKGAIETLEKQSLKAIIIEIIGGAARYDLKDRDITDILAYHWFKPIEYDPFDRVLYEHDNKTQNYIYIRDKTFVRNRVLSAEKFKVWDKEI